MSTSTRLKVTSFVARSADTPTTLRLSQMSDVQFIALCAFGAVVIIGFFWFMIKALN